MKAKYETVEFENDKRLLNKWREGNTGCPIVDAAMRHLSTKGFMPNRLRMVTSNFLIKDLLIDWRCGEKYFAQNLVDYDPSQNNGGWQWAAGCGTDSQPYFRVFNPKLQSEKFDSDCAYILTWIPELKAVKKEHIHDWENSYKLYKDKNINYPDPLVVHTTQKEKFLKMYKRALYADEMHGADDEEDEEKKSKSKREVTKTKLKQVILESPSVKKAKKTKIIEKIAVVEDKEFHIVKKTEVINIKKKVTRSQTIKK